MRPSTLLSVRANDAAAMASSLVSVPTANFAMAMAKSTMGSLSVERHHSTGGGQVGSLSEVFATCGSIDSKFGGLLVIITFLVAGSKLR